MRSRKRQIVVATRACWHAIINSMRRQQVTVMSKMAEARAAAICVSHSEDVEGREEVIRARDSHAKTSAVPVTMSPIVCSHPNVGTKRHQRECGGKTRKPTGNVICKSNQCVTKLVITKQRT